MRAALLALVAALAAGGGCSYPHLIDEGKVDEAYWKRVVDGTVRARGLPPDEKPVAYEVVSIAKSRTLLLEEVDRDFPAAKLEAMELANRTLGFWKEKRDLRAAAANLFAAEAAGFYLPARKRFYFVADGNVPSATLVSWTLERDVIGEFIVSHELVHALQDRRYDLARFLRATPENDDATLARRAVAEGDAMYYSLAYIAGDMQSVREALSDIQLDREELVEAGSPDLRRAPRIDREQMVFPYVDGLALVRMVAKDPKIGIEALWKRPPRSTEQVLHPERYSTDEPVAVTLGPGAAPPGLRLVRENTVGELGIRALLMPSEGKEGVAAAERAAEGWGGDRYRVYADAAGQQAALVWALVFDTPGDAREFVQTYRKFQTRKWLAEASICTLVGERGVAVVEAPDGKILQALAGQVLR